jgi:hypothetical protein
MRAEAIDAAGAFEGDSKSAKVHVQVLERLPQFRGTRKLGEDGASVLNDGGVRRWMREQARQVRDRNRGVRPTRNAHLETLRDEGLKEQVAREGSRVPGGRREGRALECIGEESPGYAAREGKPDGKARRVQVRPLERPGVQEVRHGILGGHPA